MKPHSYIWKYMLGTLFCSMLILVGTTRVAAQTPEIILQAYHANDISLCKLSKDRKYVLTTSKYEGNQVKITEVKSGLVYDNINLATKAVTDFVLTKSGILVFGSDDGFIRVYNVKTRKLIKQFASNRGVSHLDINEAETEITVGEFQLERYSLATGKIISSVVHEAPRSIQYADDGLTYVNYKGGLRIFKGLKMKNEVDFRTDVVKTVKVANGRGLIHSPFHTYVFSTTKFSDSIRLVNSKNQNPREVDSFELMQEVFAQVSRGSGTHIISAAAGDSYAIESDEWKNGVFTYSILGGVKTGKADENKNGTITISELRDFAIKNVEELTNGAQVPMVRQDNLEYDFSIWNN